MPVCALSRSETMKRQKNILLFFSFICVGVMAVSCIELASMPLATPALTKVSLNLSDDLYLFDAQSQFSHEITAQEVLDIIRKSGVQRVVLSTTQKQSNDIVYEIAKQDPERIIPGVRLKIPLFYHGPDAEFERFFSRQLERWSKYCVITEALIYHAEKDPQNLQGRYRQEFKNDPYSPRLQYVIKKAKELDIPVVLHVESRSLAPGRRLELWGNLEKLMRENRQVSFVYTHLSQLDSEDVRKLLDQYENTYFFLQGATLSEHNYFSQNIRHLSQWTCVFCEEWTCNKGDLKPEWKRLFLDYPSKFIFAMDGVESWLWKQCYENAVIEWKIAISKLPIDVGRKIAHENAERLWHIKPLYQF
jgi:predicted TIM-barrel fold metal-dependent hydrolase